MRAREGTVVLDKRISTWNFLWWENGKRRSKQIGTLKQYPTKSSAWRAAKALREMVENQMTLTSIAAPMVRNLIEEYRAEKMPVRASTKRGYEAWFRNHVVPSWGNHPLTDLQARPVELWLQSLELSPKSKLHIRGLLSVLWDYAMWRGDVTTQRNPMELVSIKGATKRTRHPRSLTVEHFQLLLAQFKSDLCFRTMLLLAVNFGLRVSEVLGLKWKDVDWLGKAISIQRGVVKQIVDDVKSAYSAKTMVIADELLEVLKLWRQVTQFAGENDWMFPSVVKLGRQPLSYTHIWETLSDAATKAGIGHISSHTFRHTYRTWLDSVGTPVGVQQKLMRHADIRTTMNIYGDAATEDMRQASKKVARLALPQA
jgi:integrase